MLVETIEPLWKRYGCADLLTDEYRNRSLLSQDIRLHRYAPTKISFSPPESPNVDTIYHKYFLADSNELSMAFTTGNCVGIFLNADKFQLNNLRSKALEFICDHFEAVPIECMQQIDTKNFQDVLKNDQITAAESIVFDRLFQWMDKNKTVAAEVTSSMLELIRLHHIPIAVSHRTLLIGI